jgi:hypothetical protein
MSLNSLKFDRHGDKEHSPFFEENLIRLLEERDRLGLTSIIHEIDALMITVDPEHSIEYVAELALMTPYHYLVTLETEKHWTHVLRIDLNSPDILLREVKDPNFRGIFRSLNEIYPVGAKKPNSRYMGEIIRIVWFKCSNSVNLGFLIKMKYASWNCQAILRLASPHLTPTILLPI